MLKYYADLSPYHYGMGLTIPEVVNIGWLSTGNEFNTGKVDPVVVEKLKDLILSADKMPCDILVDRLRGSCSCPLCGESDLKISNQDEYFFLGSAEIWIPSHRTNNYYYATFGLIIHYIEEHNYRPPVEFIKSVLALDSDTEFNGQSVKNRLGEKHFGSSLL
jgi:hypothetical protein